MHAKYIPEKRTQLHYIIYLCRCYSVGSIREDACWTSGNVRKDFHKAQNKEHGLVLVSESLTLPSTQPEAGKVI